ncbi:MAG: hypothetical protein KGI38_01265 [Thaumarchaeota archaeon]|nr:hypothetical protein [Nitrososphaerota archaeon]
MEHWVEINLEGELAAQDGILLDVLRAYVRGLEREGQLVTYHYFREPEIRFRVRMKTKGAKKKQRLAISRIADSLLKKELVTAWHFGNHGEEGEYVGEEDRYGENGWKVAQDYFRNGSDTALALLDLKRRAHLESPLWGKGLGNPWEGGDRNPWMDREEDPLVYHWSRFVHLFSNQVGFDMGKEVELCLKQADRYGRVMKEFGMNW